MTTRDQASEETSTCCPSEKKSMMKGKAASNLEQQKDHNLLFQLLKVVSCTAGRPTANNLCGLLESFHPCKSSVVSVEKTLPLLSGATNSTMISVSRNTVHGIITTSKPIDTAEEKYVHYISHTQAPPFPSQHTNSLFGVNEIYSWTKEIFNGGRTTTPKLNDFDLNIVYTDIHDCKQKSGEKIQGNCFRFSMGPNQNVDQRIPPYSGSNNETSAKLLPSSSEDVEVPIFSVQQIGSFSNCLGESHLIFPLSCDDK